MKIHTIERIEFAGDTMVLHVDGRRVEIELPAVSARLAGATARERQDFEVSPSGYGIHWPALDEDLSVDGLLDIRHAPKPRLVEHVAEDPPLATQSG